MSVVVLMSTYTFFCAFQLFVLISVSTNTVHEKIASPMLVGPLLCVCSCDVCTLVYETSCMFLPSVCRCCMR